MADIPDAAIEHLHKQATRGVSTGRQSIIETQYRTACTIYHGATGTIALFTRDSGHHSSGWMKNPDYERCLHLSLSFRQPSLTWDSGIFITGKTLNRVGLTAAHAPFNSKVAALWVEKIFGTDAKLSWCEGPFTAMGRQIEVRHFRVFCDPSWTAIKPRGEVYSTDFTEKGWRSWSELNVPMPSHVDAD